jgi:hypothetical protein
MALFQREGKGKFILRYSPSKFERRFQDGDAVKNIFAEFF